MPLPADPIPEITLNADVPLPAAFTPEAVESLVGHILRTEGVTGEWELGIELVDDETMQAAHVEFMGIDEPTDIMTFPYGDDEDDGFDIEGNDEAILVVAGGDLMISVDTAAENAALAGWETSEELFFLVAHGMLHLLGWDDATDDERGAMLAHQSALITSWPEAPAATS